jgi:hypothetical protein
MSEQDIDAGAFWDDEVRASLSVAKFGVVCVTADNVAAPWLNYEAGALAERLSGSVCPYLFGMRKNDLVAAPLSRLQAQEADRDGTFALVVAVNKRLGDDAISDSTLLESFETFWPRLRDRLSKIHSLARPPRPDSEKIDEILTLMQTNTSVLSKLALTISAGELEADQNSTHTDSRIEILLQQRLFQLPEFNGWSVRVARFGNLLQARFVASDGKVIERKLKATATSDPVEGFVRQFLVALRSSDAL